MKKEKKVKNDKYVIKSMNVFRVIVCSIVVCIVLGFLLYMFHNALPDVIDKLEEEGKMENFIEILKYNSHIPPVIILVGVIALFYAGKDKYIPVGTQKEKLIVSSVAAAFTYFVMLPYVMIISRDAAAFGGSAIDTVLDGTVTWFAAQIIPFIILISYHAIRMSSEKKELEQNEDLE